MQSLGEESETTSTASEMSAHKEGHLMPKMMQSTPLGTGTALLVSEIETTESDSLQADVVESGIEELRSPAKESRVRTRVPKTFSESFVDPFNLTIEMNATSGGEESDKSDDESDDDSEFVPSFEFRLGSSELDHIRDYAEADVF